MGEKKDSFRFTVQFNAGDPSHQQVAGMRHQIEQVAEPRLAVSPCPPVIFDLRPRYPRADDLHQRRGIRVHRCILRHHSTSYPTSLPPFPMCPALPDPEYYGGSASLPVDQQTTCSTHPGHAGRAPGQADRTAFPCSLAVRWSKEAPGYLPAASPAPTP